MPIHYRALSKDVILVRRVLNIIEKGKNEEKYREEAEYNYTMNKSKDSL